MKTYNLDEIASNILQYLNNNATNIVSGLSLNSPRAIGDAVQEYLADDALENIFKEYNIKINDNFSRRAMEDMAFSDNNGNYYAVDVKTHNKGTVFNMPNLISVKRLATFYKNDKKNNFCILLISYEISEMAIKYTECYFKRIESFNWNSLTIGALGWGQIQIANSNNISEKSFLPALNRKKWMINLCDYISAFYDEEIGKIGERKTWFNKMKDYWENEYKQ